MKEEMTVEKIADLRLDILLAEESIKAIIEDDVAREGLLDWPGIGETYEELLEKFIYTVDANREKIETGEVAESELLKNISKKKATLLVLEVRREIETRTQTDKISELHDYFLGAKGKAFTPLEAVEVFDYVTCAASYGKNVTTEKSI